MTKVWLASDLCLSHDVGNPDHMALVEGRTQFRWPNGAERSIGEYFFTAWEEMISGKDTIYILGNVALGATSYWFQRIREMPGTKRIILGRNDRNRVSWYSKFGFDVVVAYGEGFVIKSPYGNVLLTDRPMHTSHKHSDKYQKMFSANNCILNIHGSTHGKTFENHNTFDASLENIDYAPITLAQVLEHKFVSNSRAPEEVMNYGHVFN
jgi:calcineurin-like phosphoesterase family protein